MNTTTKIRHCHQFFFNVSSNGLWENLKSPDVIFGYSLPLLEIQILLVISFIFLSNIFFKRIGISQICSCMLAGLILGPQLFDLNAKSTQKLSLDPALNGNAAIKGVSVSGTILFTFLMSVKTSRRLVFNNGPLPIVIGILNFMLPLFIGNFLRYLNLKDLDSNYMTAEKALAERTVIVSTQSSILLPTVVYILFELKILNSELGRFVLSASMVNDILGVTLSVVAYTAGTYENISPAIAFRDVIAIIVFIIFVFFVFRPMVEWIIEKTPEGKPVEEKYIHFVILIALGSSAYTTFFNMEYALGPFLAGLVVPDGPPLGSILEAKYEKLAMNVLLPISIAGSTMRCDVMRIIYEINEIQYNIFLIFVTLVSKLAAGLVPCLYCKLPIKESFAISIILSTKSFAEIFLYETTYDVSYLSQATYTLLVIYVLLNAGIVPVILRSLYDPKRKYISYRKKNVLHLKPNSDLRILACLHRPENISGTIALLQLLSSPKQDLPIVVTILHLVKLVGQFVPVLISHTKKSKRLVKNSYIHTANLAFREFEQDNIESTTVTMFTSLSYENLMHQDICTLALDQTTSMIIVPSGRKWTIDGTFESDNETIRRLNVSLLDHSPCSIGILVDRGHFSRRGKKRSYKTDVGLIFIGGKDDREALSLVNRMKHNSCVHLTVIRLVFEQEIDSTNWEHILDHELLKEIKDSKEGVNGVEYEEKIVNNGPELAKIVRLLTEKYDLLVVGKDHSVVSPDFSGLTEWIELPELGVIGDLLAAKDLSSRVSVLVVQQEQHGT